MIICRTPLRVSFFGGGTDYPAWFKENKGAVIATTIDKYIYITCRYLPPFFKHKSRIVWSLIETVKDISEIQHPSVKACLEFMKIDRGLEIHYDADLPSRTGLGSSSSFTVGLLNSLYALKGKLVSKEEVAKDAIYVEQKILKENVGCQDQILAAYGGFKLIEFLPGGDFKITPIIIEADRMELFQKHLVLIFTGFSRTASEIAGDLVKRIPAKKEELNTMHNMVFEAAKILAGNCSLNEFGKLLDETWKIKRNLSSKISNGIIDDIYARAKKAGALGGKLLGAGGGGFMLFFAEPDKQERIRKELKEYLHVPFKFEDNGCQIIFYHPEVDYDVQDKK